MQPTLDDLHSLARGAGEILRSAYGKAHQVRFKSRIDPVTDTDQRSEAYLLEQIGKKFPDDTIVAEESGQLNGQHTHRWIIDPLDGTVNFSHDVPIFSVSIAYAEGNRLLLGAVYDPMRDEMFSAERGQGAYLNGERLAVSESQELLHSLLVTGFPYDILTTPSNNLQNFINFSLRTQGVRRLGSAAQDLCYVAAGRFDGYWEGLLKIWDLAAGALVVEEAGGMITALDGSPEYFKPPYGVIAANPFIHPQMLELLIHPPA